MAEILSLVSLVVSAVALHQAYFRRGRLVVSCSAYTATRYPHPDRSIKTEFVLGFALKLVCANDGMRPLVVKDAILRVEIADRRIVYQPVQIVNFSQLVDTGRLNEHATIRDSGIAHFPMLLKPGEIFALDMLLFLPDVSVESESPMISELNTKAVISLWVKTNRRKQYKRMETVTFESEEMDRLKTAKFTTIYDPSVRSDRLEVLEPTADEF